MLPSKRLEPYSKNWKRNSRPRVYFPFKTKHVCRLCVFLQEISSTLTLATSWAITRVSWESVRSGFPLCSRQTSCTSWERPGRKAATTSRNSRCQGKKKNVNVFSTYLNLTVRCASFYPEGCVREGLPRPQAPHQPAHRPLLHDADDRSVDKCTFFKLVHIIFVLWLRFINRFFLLLHFSSPGV